MQTENINEMPREIYELPQRHIERYLKNGALKSILRMIKNANFQLYRVQLDGVI